MMSASMSGKPAFYGLLALSAMEVVANQPPDSPLAWLQQPNHSFDASTDLAAIAPAESLSVATTQRSDSSASVAPPSVEATTPQFSPQLAPSATITNHSSASARRSPGRSAIASTHFQDVQAHWSQPFVELLAVRGIVRGYGDGTFQPDRQIEAAHFGSMLQQAQLYRLRALQRELGSAPASARGRAESQLLAASALPPVSETEATRLLQTHDIRTRAQAAVFIYRNFQSPSFPNAAVSYGAIDSQMDPLEQLSMRSPNPTFVAKSPSSIPLPPNSETNFSAQFSDRIL